MNGSDDSTTYTFEFPYVAEGGVQTLELPVIFDNEQSAENLDLSAAKLEEVRGEDLELPSEFWNSECAIFLPKREKTKVVVEKKKSKASVSRILTSDEVIQAKIE